MFYSFITLSTVDQAELLHTGRCIPCPCDELCERVEAWGGGDGHLKGCGVRWGLMDGDLGVVGSKSCVVGLRGGGLRGILAGRSKGLWGGVGGLRGMGLGV